MKNYQLIIVGGGPAGYTAAEEAGKAGLNVLLIEKNKLGGVCLNEGCIPTKTLLYSAKIYDNIKHAAKYGIAATNYEFSLKKIVSRKSKVVRKLVLGVQARVLATEYVEILKGDAFVTGEHTVRCDGEEYYGDNILIATGSETFVPPIKGLNEIEYWTHREALDNKELPQSLAIIGGGVIGMEFASFFNSLGVKVTVIEMLPEIINGIDSEIATMLREHYSKNGVEFMLQTKVTQFKNSDSGISVTYENSDGSNSLVAEKVLLSVGRRPVVRGFGLEDLPLETTERGAIKVNDKMQTSLSHLYLCGDVTGYSLLAHTAVREAQVAVHSILCKDDAMHYRAIPGVVYTNPEVASVGETEVTAKSKGIDVEVRQLPMTYSGRFVAENEGFSGWCKLIVDSTTHEILGGHLIGNPASELITLIGIAIDKRLTLDELKCQVFPHPTVSEIFKEAL